MSKLPKISDSEWEVMEVIWLKKLCTSSEIVDALKDNSEWSPKTIHTLITRLVKKGAVDVDKTSTTYKYSPLISEKDLKSQETKTFVQKLYGGSLKLLLSNFIKEEELSADEIHELRKLLDEKTNK
ncbi:BlaI/MecI/CopY family transcriptional regulator [Clostridium folliculivorans]|uniref:Transcriptional regulator n=1 Tax=Clostridium folliculivorans TaxID=2886038 RepID=A0A9W5Y4D5_9CLOT|nr:BlaI/MecI/CopY family transcriptional regulator [Clostridium folliculivorans]GKU26526.1 transcriptional regulator [Clostridium folliculivorans]GKU29042.1 transcriptional regulator [Clostridium folliculivorans]